MVIIKRLKQVNKFMLSLLLVVSLILPSFSSLAGPGAASSGVGDHKIPVNSPHIPMKGMNLLVSLVEVDNTAYKYQAAIEAHNASMPTDPWSEMQISVVDNHLYDYPSQILNKDSIRNSAVIRLNRKSTQPMLFADTSGIILKSRVCKNVYSCDGKTAPTDFSSIDIIGSAIKSNPTYFSAFKNGQMSLELVKALVQANESKAKVWADKFVALWANMENADDVINGIYDGADSAYYENQLRYLDLLVAVNYLCHGGQEVKLTKYLKNLNMDGSSTFITLCIATCVYSELPSGKSAALPMPVFYSLATGNPMAMAYQRVIPDGANTSAVTMNTNAAYEDSPGTYAANLQAKYENQGMRARTGYTYLLNNAKNIWWNTPSSYKLGTALRPTDMWGKSTGNCSYTFLPMTYVNKTNAAVLPNVVNPPTAVVEDDIKEYPEAQFGIYASSDRYLVNKGEIVEADIRVDLTQTPEFRQKLRNAYTAQLVKTGKTEATLVIQYRLSDDSVSKGSTFLDTSVFPTGMSNTPAKVMIPQLTWEKAVTFFDGRVTVHWKDTDIKVDEACHNKYYAKVSLIFENGYEVKFSPLGKYIGDQQWEANDVVYWVPKEDPHDPVVGVYSNTIKGNFAEIKDEYVPHYSEAWEAMAGLPTTENLYLGIGATEFMTNINVAKERDTKAVRKYYFTKTFDNCCYDDEYCEISCPGHSTSKGCSSCDGTLNPTTSDDGKCGASARTLNLVCSKDSSHTGTIDIPAATYIKANMTDHKVKCAISKTEVSHLTGADTGCQLSCKTNCVHPKALVAEGTINQKIMPYTYLDITDLDLWRVSKLKYDYNKDLLDSVSKSEWDPETGYRAFYNQKNYSSDNGRIAFDWIIPNGNGEPYYGDTSKVYPSVSTLISKEEALRTAHKEFDNDVVGATVKATVISDYLTLTTTEGYQIPTYNDQVSLETSVLPAGESFSAHNNEISVEFDKCASNAINFTTERTWDHLWKHDADALGLSSSTPESGNMSYSAYSWDEYGIVRSGYNGEYEDRSKKYVNNNDHLKTIDPAKQWLDYKGIKQPNSEHKEGSVAFAKDAANFRMTVLGMNIIDVCTKPSDTEAAVFNGNPTPVHNGYWDTGNCWLEAEYAIKYNNADGAKWSTAGNPYKQELGYTYGVRKVNNIIVHDPTSVMNAEIIGGSNDASKFVDQRSSEDLIEGGDPSNKDTGVCPGDYTCQFRTLDCHDPEQGKVCSRALGCETLIGGQYICDGTLNAHDHVDKCYTSYSFSSNSPCAGVEHEIGEGLYFIEVAGGSGGGNGSRDGYNGARVTGTFTVPAGSTKKLKITIGERGYDLAGGNPSIVDLGSGNIIKAAGGIGYGVTESTSSIDLAGNVVDASCSMGSLSNPTLEYNSIGNGYVRIFRVKASGTVEQDVICGYAYKWYYDAEHKTYFSKCTTCGTSMICTSKEAVLVAGANQHTVKKVINLYTEEKVTACDGKHNIHVHNSACKKSPEKWVNTCMNPHHRKSASDTWDPKEPKNHFTNSNLCWKACGNDSKHAASSAPIIIGDKQVSCGEYLNLDREFTITFPSIGNFEQKSFPQGVKSLQWERGCINPAVGGYYSGMNTDKWTRDKFVSFTFDVIYKNGASGGKLYRAGEQIPVYTLDADGGGYPNYKFYIPLENSEQASGFAQFTSVALNAPVPDGDLSPSGTDRYFVDNSEFDNKERDKYRYGACHSAYKIDYTDLIGYIGSLTINDTGDLRFAELFKQTYLDEEEGAGWLIPNVVRKVKENVPNKLVIDAFNVRQDKAGDSYWHDIYSSTAGDTGNLYLASGGKHYENILLPLTPEKNPNKALRNQPLRPGYNLLMDIQTVGNYYGENRKVVFGSWDDSTGTAPVLSSMFVDDNEMYYKMQIIPRYYLLDLDSGKYTKLDVYMGVNNEYELCNRFGFKSGAITKTKRSFNLYVSWLEESARRNYTKAEQKVTNNGVVYFSGLGAYEYTSDLGVKSVVENPMGSARSPQAAPDIIGNAQIIFLNDINRTFVGGEYTYGTLHNDSVPENRIPTTLYETQAQRWHFTLGLPSSSVFIGYGSDGKAQKCTTENIKKVQETNGVIVCKASILVRGDIWTLRYDGSGTNAINGEHWLFKSPGKAYKQPDSDDPSASEDYKKDPIIAVYSNKYTSKDDLRTEGTH